MDNKLTLRISIFSVLLASTVILYYKWPSGFMLKQADGPSVYADFARNYSEKKEENPDPYASSAYQPGDDLYEPLLAVQQRRWNTAKELLEPLVEENNTTAMFWLAEINTDARLFQKAANLGNPYAALRLDINNDECMDHMRLYCHEKWGKLAKKVLQERAKEGDIKAKYAIQYHFGKKSKSDHEDYIKLSIEGAKINYYEPLFNILKDYKYRWNLPFWAKDEILSDEELDILSKLFSLMVDNNFPMALFYIDSEGDDFKKYSFERYHSLLGEKASLLFDYYISKVETDREYLVKGYAIAILSDSYRHSNKKNRGENLYSYKVEDAGYKMSDIDIEKAKALAKEMKKKSTPVIYIDEIEPRKYL